MIESYSNHSDEVYFFGDAYFLSQIITSKV